MYVRMCLTEKFSKWKMGNLSMSAIPLIAGKMTMQHWKWLNRPTFR